MRERGNIYMWARENKEILNMEIKYSGRKAMRLERACVYIHIYQIQGSSCVHA